MSNDKIMTGGAEEGVRGKALSHMVDGSVNWHNLYGGQSANFNQNTCKNTSFDPVPFLQTQITHTLTNVDNNTQSRLYTEALFKIAKNRQVKYPQ